MARTDYRSAEAAAYRVMYKTRRWQAIRSIQLRAKPLCEWCETAGRTTLANVCDHAIAHKGDEELFYGGPFLSLCKPCHDGAGQKRDARGYSGAVDLSGWPTDLAHPVNRKRQDLTR